MDDKRPRYPVICPSCKKTIYVCKSIFHELGMNEFGGGNCIHCGTHLHLSFAVETQSMKARLYTDWAMKREVTKTEEIEPDSQEGSSHDKTNSVDN